jgi:hypothetical protein
MSAGELETLSRLQVPAVLIHFNNACFGWIKALQRVVDRDRARKASEMAWASGLDGLAVSRAMKSATASAPRIDGRLMRRDTYGSAFGHRTPSFRRRAGPPGERLLRQ